MANGVRLKGAVGFSEFRHNKKYSGEGKDGEWGPETGVSGCKNVSPDPTALAISCLFQRPAISYVTLPFESRT
jgi:hypothetical protein